MAAAKKAKLPIKKPLSNAQVFERATEQAIEEFSCGYDDIADIVVTLGQIMRLKEVKEKIVTFMREHPQYLSDTTVEE